MNDAEFEEFLKGVGLALEQRLGPDGQPFGNWIIKCGNADLAVSLISDRGVKGVYITDKYTARAVGVRPHAPARYDVPLIQEMLQGIPLRPRFFENQIEFVRTNWNAILEMLAPDRRAATHERLSLLRLERYKRGRNPWPPAILKFEEILQSKGLICQSRQVPDGVLGERLLVYSGSGLSVKIDSTDGWGLMFSETTGRPENWYYIRTLRAALIPNPSPTFQFREWFQFATEHWDAIKAMFQAPEREATHQRLAPLEEETRRRRAEFLAKQAAQMKGSQAKLAQSYGTSRDSSRPPQ